jgi:hypothetical protein
MRWLALTLIAVNLAYYWYARDFMSREAPAATAVIGAQRLQLLSEPVDLLPPIEPVAISSPEGVSSVENIEERVMHCWELGPLDAETSEKIAALYAEEGLPMRLFQREQVEVRDFWVYLAVTNPGELDEYRQSMEQDGFDSYIIASGELEGNLSLGLFSSKPRAEAAARPLQERGLPVIIHSRTRRRNENWLSLNSSEVQVLDWSADLSNLILWPRPGIYTVDCDGVSTTELP